MDGASFESRKIYEKLQVTPEPENYSGRIPWTVQQQIAATNGIHFLNAVGHLKEYPIPPIPIKEAGGQKLFLDIGNGWGRWLVAAARKNYIPIGIDLRLEFCSVSRTVLKDNGFNGYTAVADLRSLPFLDNIFDVVWSFSVIQHTHYQRMTGCLSHIQRILNPAGGYCYLEFPNKNGLHNRLGPARKFAGTADDYDSWDVRYYTAREYRNIFGRFFDNFNYYNHSALGIGVLPGDFKYATGWINKAGILMSRSLTRFFDVIPPLKAISDSIYISCVKQIKEKNDDRENISKFLKAHAANPCNNLNLVHILCCPATQGPVRLSEDGTEIISERARLAYQIKNDTPIMVTTEARSL